MALAANGLWARFAGGWSSSAWSSTTWSTPPPVTVTVPVTLPPVTVTDKIPVTIIDTLPPVTDTIDITDILTVTDTLPPISITVTITKIDTITKILTRNFTSTTTTTSSCRGPVSTIYAADVYEYSPAPGVPPLATHYVTVNHGTTEVASIFCNTEVFRKYFRPSIFNCACNIGPIQTVNQDCEIVVGPIFTTGCDDNGIFVTQTGPRGTVASLLTTLTLSSCGSEVVSTYTNSGIALGATQPTLTSTPPIVFGSTTTPSPTPRLIRRGKTASTVTVSGTVAGVNTLIKARGAKTSTSAI